MTQLRTIEGEGLILSGADSRDDRIIRLLMADDELVPAIVRQGRRPGKRSKVGRIQPLTAVQVTLRARPADDLAVLETVVVERPFAVVKADLLRLAMATCMAEVVLHLCPDWGREPGVHDLLRRAWERLDRPSSGATGDAVTIDWLILFELKALAASGVLPPIEELAEIPRAARESMAGWLEGRWAPLDRDAAAVAQRTLEALVTSASGRPFRSTSLLAEAMR
ncbi:MAG: DNA repair protein RecO C-terminal domain-containing protein [Deltaproteobacteria bacterium]|nr:DNA repair protein RecO C-terminal domain-containing protein [Deltaproteobacteria bacterium]